MGISVEIETPYVHPYSPVGALRGKRMGISVEIETHTILHQRNWQRSGKRMGISVEIETIEEEFRQTMGACVARGWVSR